MLPFVLTPVRPQRQPFARFCLFLMVVTAMLAGLTGKAIAGPPPTVVFTGGLTSAGFGQVPVGTTSATQTLNFTIDAGTTIATPAVLTTGTPGLDFADAGGDTCTAGTYGSTTNCVVNVTLKPAAPGLREGAVVISDGSGNVLASGPLFGVGTGPLADFLPGTESKIGSGFSFPYGVTVDAAGNIYVADTNHNAVKEIVAAGGYTTINTLGGGFNFPESVAVDGAGNVFVADYYNNAVKQIPPGCTSSACVVTVGSGFSYPSGVAVDANGNVYVADSGNNAVKEVEAAGGYSTVDTLGSGFSSPTGVAVDLNGNLFVADYGNSAVKEALAAGGYTTINTLGSGYIAPVGVSLDASDNVYVADLETYTVNEIVAAGGYTTINNVATLTQPEGLALDSIGNIYVVANHDSEVVKFDLADNPSLTLAVSTLGTPSSDSPHSVIMSNNGNEPLTLDVPPSGTSPSISGAAFTLGTGVGADCPQIAAGTTPGSLPAGSSCLLPVTFTPVLEGANTGAITVTDNTLNVDGTVQTVALNGLGGDAIQVTVGSSVPGLLFSVDRTSYTTTQTFNWITGQQHTLASLDQTSVDGETEYHITGWSDGTVGFEDVITVTTGVTSYAAEFSPTYLLAVAPNVGAYGTVTPVNYAYYAPGTVVNITATPTGGSFTNWTTTGNISDIASPTSLATTITINSPEIVTANFVPLVGSLSSAGNFGSQLIGTATSPQAVNVSLLAGTTVGSFGVFTQGSTSLDFTMVSGGTCAATTYPTASTCTVNVVFNPIAAGLRQGAVVFFSGAGYTGLIVGNVPVFGMGTGPQIIYSPAPQFTVPNSQTVFPIGVARDGAGDLFVASIAAGLGGGSVVEVPAGGGTNFVVGTGWSNPTGVAIDGAGDLFVADFFGGTVQELPVGGGTQFQVPYNGYPTGIAVDASGNVYIADSQLAQVVQLAADTGYQTRIGSGWYGPTGVAVDAVGNVYVVDESASTVTQVPAGTNTLNTLQGPLALSPTGWTDPVGVAVDDVGNVYVADESLGVVELAAGSFTPTTILSPAITPAEPSGVAVDLAGDLFVSDASTGSEIELQRSNPLGVNFPTSTPADTTDTTDGTKTVQLQNIGTSNLTFYGINYPADFPMAIGDPNACSVSTPLAAGSICDLPVTFAPQSVGSLPEDLTLTDNAMNVASVQQLIPVSGIGKAVPAALTYPNPGSLAGISQLFTWNAGSGVTQYALRIGSTGAGSTNLYYGPATTAMSATVSALPINGETIYVTLLSQVSGVWQSNAYTFTAFTGVAATLNPISGGTTLGGISQVFTWSTGTGVTQYVLRVGSAGVGSSNLYNGPYTTNLSATVNNLPVNGEPIYAQLWSLTGGIWQSNSYTFNAFTGVAASLTAPTTSSLGGASQLFTWQAGTSAAQYVLRVGSTGVGSSNLYNGPSTTNTSVTVSHLPINGETIYVQLWSLTGGIWLNRNYTFAAFAGTPATLNPLSGGSTLSGISQVFTWTAGAGNTLFQLRVGTTGVGSSNLYNGAETTNTSATVSNLPINGETIYVRLFSLAGGFWLSNDYTFNAFTGTAATLNPLSGGSTLSGASQLFAWTPGAGDTQYALRIGSTGAGSSNLYNGGYTTSTSVTVNKLPTNGETVYVRLFSFTGGLWLYNDYIFTAY